MSAETFDELEKSLQTLYPVNDVSTGYSYYVRNLTEKCLGMFTYENLPTNLPSDEIEIRLIKTGYCCIFKHKDFGIVTAYGGLSDFDLYYKPLKFIYTQPKLGSNNLKLHDDCAILYNSYQDSTFRTGLYPMICRYARLLADIDSSIDMVTINTRATNLVTAKTAAVAKSVQAVLDKIEKGELNVITENSILDNINTFAFGNNGRNNTLQELLLTRDSMIKSFFSEIGVKSANDKKERLITDEVESDKQLLLLNPKDMLQHRQIGIEEANKLFNLNIKVFLSPEYSPNANIPVYKEGEENDIE